MPRVLSGIQPSGDPHLGNYFGAIRGHVESSRAATRPTAAGGDGALFFVADLHALTTVHDRAVLERNVRGIAATYVALGLDTQRAVFFRQSDIPEVTELSWLLATVTGMGLLERGHSYKDKIARGLPASVGLFTYPILMTADIVIYDSDVVPVGQDQVQHIEMAADMVGHFNTTHGGEFLRKPKWTLSPTPKVPGTDGAKMSKSYGNDIWIRRGQGAQEERQPDRHRLAAARGAQGASVGQRVRAARAVPVARGARRLGGAAARRRRRLRPPQGRAHRGDGRPLRRRARRVHRADGERGRAAPARGPARRGRQRPRGRSRRRCWRGAWTPWACPTCAGAGSGYSGSVATPAARSTSTSAPPPVIARWPPMPASPKLAVTTRPSASVTTAP
ncbi:MAG: tryptophan--tRNA ligase [Kofleriaceae bacterium]